MANNSTLSLSAEVLDILNRSTITDTLLVLPPGQLDRKTYESVAKAIQLAGGKWNRGKAGFVFTSDPRAVLGLAVNQGTIIDTKKLRQAYFTPEAVADEVARIADVAGKRVLEPSAGDGALVKACLDQGAYQVDCIALEPSCRDSLTGINRVVMIGDFLAMDRHRQYERIVMNPPFTKGQYHKHVARAKEWLSPHGKLFAVVPANDCAKVAALGAVTVAEFPAGSFRESGTNVATRLVRIEG